MSSRSRLARSMDRQAAGPTLNMQVRDRRREVELHEIVPLLLRAGEQPQWRVWSARLAPRRTLAPVLSAKVGPIEIHIPMGADGARQIAAQLAAVADEVDADRPGPTPAEAATDAALEASAELLAADADVITDGTDG